MAAANPDCGLRCGYLSTAKPGSIMVVFLWPDIPLGRRHLELSQLSTPSGSLRFHTRATRFCIFLVALMAITANAFAMATLDDAIVGSALGSI